jgi:hypothetical protein
MRLAASLRARDAEAILKEADKVVLDIGNRLAKATDYEDHHVWLSDFRVWTKALETIDDIVSRWEQTKRPFLDIRRAEYEQPSEAPPPNIRSDLTLTPYKTVCLARNRYLLERGNIFAYFDSKVRDI